jgi:hypothetical protein
LRKIVFKKIQISTNRFLLVEIPLNVQRCCTRCYEKLIIQVRQRQTTNQEEDDDDDESSKIQSNSQEDGSSKHNDGRNSRLFVFFIDDNLLFCFNENKRMDRK